MADCLLEGFGALISWLVRILHAFWLVFLQKVML
uniref:Uncharacterized protein n=1 Tax=Anguilla anguilla TaxID=7936 RepID=A0A0E9QNL5_ANGAN